MSVKRLSYRDLPPALRKKGAGDARQRILMMMASPMLSLEQRAHLQGSLETLALWEKGQLPEEPLP